MVLTDSKQPRKQRKARYEASLHERQKLNAAHLSKELKGKLGIKRRSLPARKGDRVKVMRGEFRGKSGKITRVDLKSGKAYVEGVVRKRGKGGESPVPLEPSKLMIIEVDLSDKKREGILRNQRGRSNG